MRMNVARVSLSLPAGRQVSERERGKNKANVSWRSRAHSHTRSIFVPEVGIEPTLPKEHEFESCASTSSATRAFTSSMTDGGVYPDTSGPLGHFL
jgi:hypothetical protein